ncbi:type II toxin-antitoxin system RelE/ParE family toxin [Bacterioplanoides sp.]|uniref:type II toxin-antitoxin system RelE/ParE family toxin n=1 Tax=Bacterioplanoides sp. TaxID=2066072 RepID=UPI003AFF9F71
MKFKCKKTESLFNGKFVKQFSAFAPVAERKLQALDMATNVDDLRSPPGNRLEALGGDRQGSFSIRINKQYRICFGWEDGEAVDIEITDYH